MTLKNSVKAHNEKMLTAKRGPLARQKIGNRKGLKGFSWVHFLEDPIFNSYVFNKFAGLFIKKGKRDKALKMLYSLFGVSEKKKIPIDLFFLMVERLRPGFICVPVRYKSNINYVPMPTTEAKAYRKSIQYIHKAIRDRRHDTTIQEKIFNEFEAFFKDQGYSNSFYETNSTNVVANGHLRHYRRFPVLK